MSKIFEALLKFGERSGLNLPAGKRNGAANLSLPARRHVAQAVAKDEALAGSAGAGDSAVLEQTVRNVRIRLAAGSPILPFDGSHPLAAEQYKIIRTKIIQHIDGPRVLVVSSAQVSDGKSLSAANVAACLALKDQTRVLLVDADLRRSALAQALGVASAPGLSDVLAGRCGLDQAIVRLEPLPNFYFLPSGDKPDNAAELLDSSRWRSVCALLRREFRFVVIDAPPVGLVADYDLIQDVADAVILVVRPDHTNRSLCLKALESIPQEKLLGVIINCVTDWFLSRALGHDYSYYSDKPK